MFTEERTAQIVRDFKPLVKAAARQYKGRGAEFDDLCQEGSLAVLRLLPRCTKEEHVALFLRMAVKRAVRDAARRLRWKEHPVDLEPYEDLAAPEDLVAVFDEPMEIELLLRKISSAQDRLIVMRLAEGATQGEIAAELGLTQQAVSARLGPIRRTLAPLVHEGEKG
ncbi:MAG: sigma-70 family RNA polymerase sigma factor [Synergistales bacterium]